MYIDFQCCTSAGLVHCTGYKTGYSSYTFFCSPASLVFFLLKLMRQKKTTESTKISFVLNNVLHPETDCSSINVKETSVNRKLIQIHSFSMVNLTTLLLLVIDYVKHMPYITLSMSCYHRNKYVLELR